MDAEDKNGRQRSEKSGDAKKKKECFQLKTWSSSSWYCNGCSVVAPLIQPVPVAANELPAQVGARINTSAFIAEISTYAQPIAQANDLARFGLVIAQAVVESGWGSSALSQSPYHNLFGNQRQLPRSNCLYEYIRIFK